LKKIYLPEGALCKEVFVKQGSIVMDKLRHGYETLIWVFKDGSIYFITNFADSLVSTGGNKFLLNEIGRDAKDLIAIYHNHNSCPKFSSADLRSFVELSEIGFVGVYAIYVRSTREFIYAEIEQAKKDLRAYEAMRMFIEKTGYNPNG